MNGFGTISAVGGTAASSGCISGGGSGGRIAVYYQFNQFNGTITVVGGVNPSEGYSGGAGKQMQFLTPLPPPPDH